MEDWIKIAIQVAVLLGGAAGIIISVRVSIAVLATKQDLHAKATEEAIDRIETAIKPLAELGTRVALIDQRLATAELRVAELQHGDGMVLPIRKGAYEHGGGNRS